MTANPVGIRDATKQPDKGLNEPKPCHTIKHCQTDAMSSRPRHHSLFCLCPQLWFIVSSFAICLS